MFTQGLEQKMSTDTAIATAASKATIVGLGALGAGWLTLDTVVTLVGFFIASVGGIVVIIFRWRAERRAEEIHKLRVKWLRSQINQKTPSHVLKEGVRIGAIGEESVDPTTY